MDHKMDHFGPKVIQRIIQAADRFVLRLYLKTVICVDFYGFLVFVLIFDISRMSDEENDIAYSVDKGKAKGPQGEYQ